MKLSFCTMGYLEYCTFEETVKRIAALGYDGIDFWASTGSARSRR